MKAIFKTEKVFVYNENMDFTGVQIRIRLFGKTVLSYQSHNKLNTI
jgi:hypothetical protein